MAEPSMFNLYDVATAENQNARTNAMNVAQLPAGRATVYGAGRAGSMLSGGINQMLGRVTPQQQKAEIVNGIMKKYINADPADPQNILMMSRDFADNDLPGLANQFMTQYQTAIKTPKASKPDTYQDNLGATRYLTGSATYKAGDLVPGEIANKPPEKTQEATSIEEFKFYVQSGGKDDYETFLANKKAGGVTVNTGDNETITKDGLKLVEDSTTASGFRYVEIEGGEAWQKTQDSLQEEASNLVKKGSQLSTKTQTEFVMNREIDSAIDYITNQTIGKPVTGKAAELYMTAPDVLTANSPAQGLRANILTIQGIIGFERLQRMRAESETGGALGQVAVQELIALQGTLGNLNLLAPKEDILERLRDIKDIYNRNMNIIRDQYTPEDLARFGFDLSGKDNLEPSRLDLIAAELSRRNL